MFQQSLHACTLKKNEHHRITIQSSRAIIKLQKLKKQFVPQIEYYQPNALISRLRFSILQMSKKKHNHQFSPFRNYKQPLMAQLCQTLLDDQPSSISQEQKIQVQGKKLCPRMYVRKRERQREGGGREGGRKHDLIIMF